MINWIHGDVLTAQLWQVTILIGLVTAINLWFRRLNPHLATLLWLVVLVKCITPPIWSSPSSLYSWMQPRVLQQHSESLDNGNRYC